MYFIRNATIILIFISIMCPLEIHSSLYGSIEHLTGKEIQEHNDVAEFKNFLEKSDKSQKEMISMAKDEFLKKFSSPENKDVDKAFRIFRKFYREVIRKCDHIFYKKRDSQELLHKISVIIGYTHENPLSAFERIDNVSSKEIKTKYGSTLKELYEYRNCGINFIQSEGDWYLKEDTEFLVEILSDFGSSELREYLLFRVSEDKERLGEDAGLLISWEDLRKRIIRWEQFTHAYPNLLETEKEIKPKLHKLLILYLTGIDNTPAYDLWKSGEIKFTLRKSYETFLKENNISSYYALINSVYNILKKHRFKINEELILFLHNQGYRNIGFERCVKRFLAKDKK